MAERLPYRRRLARRHFLGGRPAGNNSDGWETRTGPLRFVDSHPCRDETASRVGTPTFVLVLSSVGTKGRMPLTARDEIEFPSLRSLQILKEFIKRRVAAFLEVLIRLQTATSSLLASVVDSDGSFCTFNHARRLNAFIKMQNTFAGIRPYCDVCNPITQTTRTVDARNNKTGPHPSSDQDRRNDCEKTR